MVRDIATLLVVLGHVMPVCGAITFWLRFVIYTFHMPTFVFVSGFFSKKYIDKGGQAGKLAGFIIIFIAFMVLLWLC